MKQHRVVFLCLFLAAAWVATAAYGQPEDNPQAAGTTGSQGAGTQEAGTPGAGTQEARTQGAGTQDSQDAGTAGSAETRSGDGRPMPAGPNVLTIAGGLKDGALWWTILACIAFGAGGGVVYELVILQGNIEFPHRPTDDEVKDKALFAIPRNMLDLGILARVFIGGLAAVAAVWFLSPATAFSALATAMVAGSAGTSIFRSVQDRMLSALAYKEAAETKAKAQAQGEKLEEAQQEYEALKEEIAGASSTTSSTPGSPGLPVPPGSVVDSLRLDRLGDLLSQAKGVGATIQ